MLLKMSGTRNVVPAGLYSVRRHLQAFVVCHLNERTNMKSVIKLITGCCFIALLTGCASVLCGPKQSVSINSRPSGAQITIYDGAGDVVFRNVTPCIAKLNRRAKDMLDGA